MMEELHTQHKLAANSLMNVTGTPVSVVARAGAPKPDISSVDALKHTLLTARSIVYSDPAKGGASGVYFARVIDRLGIAGQLKDKTILVPGAQAADVVAKGDADVGVAQTSEIVPITGVQLVGRYPENWLARPFSPLGSVRRANRPKRVKRSLSFSLGRRRRLTSRPRC
jgi:molybdate transport system substrate-binding protein